MSTTTGKAKHPHNSTRPAPKAIQRALEKGDIKTIERLLSPRQVAFAKEYVVDFNGHDAVIRAGYTPKYAAKQAYIVLHHPGIRALIEHYNLSKEAKAMAINPDWVLQKTVTGINTAEGNNNLSALFRGLELLARHFGMLKDKQEISGPDGEAIRIQQQRVDEDAAAIQALLKQLASKTDHPLLATEK